jgi:hypothetical protein
MPVTYCERWSVKLGRPARRLSVEEARARDAAGRPWYTVVLGEVTRPECFVEVAWENTHLGVWFLDEECRPWLHHSFTRVDERRLFLDAVVRWEYPPGAGRRPSAAQRVETLTYRQNGAVHQEIEDAGTGELTVCDYTGVPVDVHWEPVPAFGDYRSVARLDRRPASG